MRKTWRALIYPVYTCHFKSDLIINAERMQSFVSNIHRLWNNTCNICQNQERNIVTLLFMAIYLQILLNYSVASRYFCRCCNWYFSIKLRRSKHNSHSHMLSRKFSKEILVTLVSITIYLQILLDYSGVSNYFCLCCNWYFSMNLRNWKHESHSHSNFWSCLNVLFWGLAFPCICHRGHKTLVFLKALLLFL